MDRNNNGASYRFGLLPDEAPLAMAYVPWQEWEKIYEDEEKALMRGTLFEALDLPWYPSACERGGNCENRSGTCRRCGDNR